MTNFIILYPGQDIHLIKKNYQSLHLPELETNIIFIIDTLQEKEIQQFVDLINKELEYSCIMNTCLEKDIQQNIVYMSGVPGDKLYFLNHGKIEEKNFK